MNSVTVQYTISAGHRLQFYDGVCASPHGHNIKFEVEVELGEGNVFLDFKHVQKLLAELLHSYDHAMILEKNDPLAAMLMQLPRARVVLLDEAPTTEYLAYMCLKHMQHRLTEYKVSRVTVYETERYSATVYA
jgi:6-pyruvoyl-tetrahydropterin synthase